MTTLKIRHTTRYEYDAPVPYALQQIRMTPKSFRSQNVIRWDTRVDGGFIHLSFDDYHRNKVHLVGFDTGTTSLTVTCEGEVEMTDVQGVVGPHAGFAPLWLFRRPTPLTACGDGCRALVATAQGDNDLDRLHDLSARIRDAVAYETGQSLITWTAEDALREGVGVCQDHAHVFIACAREMGLPARYVSGYLMMNDRIDQEATHAWAEVHIDSLGWVGFDISNVISPDTRYVRVATGLDYHDAAPVSGFRYGTASESLSVGVQVQQQ